MRKIWIQLVKLWGWQFEIPDLKDRPEIAHCVVAVAPHTAFVDYIVGAAVLFAAGVKPKIFVKKEFFNFFTRPLLLRLGLVPVDRGNRHNGLVEKAVKLLREDNNACIVITPEGTRKPVKRFKRGFYEIATQAGVPIVLGYMDFERKHAGYGPTILPTGDYEADVEKMIEYFAPISPRHPEGWGFSPEMKQPQGNDNR